MRRTLNSFQRLSSLGSDKGSPLNRAVLDSKYKEMNVSCMSGIIPFQTPDTSLKMENRYVNNNFVVGLSSLYGKQQNIFMSYREDYLSGYRV